MRRWEIVNARAREEVRRATLEEKFDEIERLMASIDDFGWREVLNDDSRVRDRWNQLRTKLSPPPTRKPDP